MKNQRSALSIQPIQLNDCASVPRVQQFVFSMVDKTLQGETFTASRWTRGNLIFPTRISVTSQHVLRTKPRLFGSTQESIAIASVASVKISTGVLWSDIRIDSAGGTNPILSHGHRKAGRAADSRSGRALSDHATR